MAKPRAKDVEGMGKKERRKKEKKSTLTTARTQPSSKALRVARYVWCQVGQEVQLREERLVRMQKSNQLQLDHVSGITMVVQQPPMVLVAILVRHHIAALLQRNAHDVCLHADNVRMIDQLVLNASEERQEFIVEDSCRPWAADEGKDVEGT